MEGLKKIYSHPAYHPYSEDSFKLHKLIEEIKTDCERYHFTKMKRSYDRTDHYVECYDYRTTPPDPNSDMPDGPTCICYRVQLNERKALRLLNGMERRENPFWKLFGCVFSDGEWN